jgi:transposase
MENNENLIYYYNQFHLIKNIKNIQNYESCPVCQFQWKNISNQLYEPLEQIIITDNYKYGKKIYKKYRCTNCQTIF